MKKQTFFRIYWNFVNENRRNFTIFVFLVYFYDIYPRRCYNKKVQYLEVMIEYRIMKREGKHFRSWVEVESTCGFVS